MSLVPAFGALPGGMEIAVLLLIAVLFVGPLVLVVVGAGWFLNRDGGGEDADAPNADRVADLESRVADLESEVADLKGRRGGPDDEN